MEKRKAEHTLWTSSNQHETGLPKALNHPNAETKQAIRDAFNKREISGEASSYSIPFDHKSLALVLN